MTRATLQDYNEIKLEILKTCTEPKSINEISEAIKMDTRISYRIVAQLLKSEFQYLKKVFVDKQAKKGVIQVLKYVTNNAFFVPEIRRTYKGFKEIEEQTYGSRVIDFSNNLRLHNLQKQTDAIRRNEYKSPKSSIGISPVYHY